MTVDSFDLRKRAANLRKTALIQCVNGAGGLGNAQLLANSNRYYNATRSEATDPAEALQALMCDIAQAAAKNGHPIVMHTTKTRITAYYENLCAEAIAALPSEDDCDARELYARKVAEGADVLGVAPFAIASRSRSDLERSRQELCEELSAGRRLLRWFDRQIHTGNRKQALTAVR